MSPSGYLDPTVVLPVKGRLDLTAPLVDEVQSQGGYREFLVLDGGSDYETLGWLRRRAGIRLIERPGSTLHERWNHAIECADGNDVVFLTNDIVLDGKPNWLGRLCAPLGRWAATCPNYDKRRDEMGLPVVGLSGTCAGIEDGTSGLAGFAFAVRGDVFDNYRFPTTMKFYSGDRDLVTYLHVRGEPYGMVLGVGVTHINGGAQTLNGPEARAIAIEDQAAFAEKWKWLIGDIRK